MIDKKKLKVVPGGKKEVEADKQFKPQGPVFGGSPLMSGTPTNPAMTLDVKNEKVEELLKVYAEDKTVDNLNMLIDAIRRARVLVPAEVKENNQPFPCAIRNKNGETFLPLYTSKEQIPEEPKSPAILNMPYLAINNMSLNIQPKADGIVINPFTNNMVFKRPLVEKIDENERKRLEAMRKAKENGTPIDMSQKPKQIKLTPEQYVIFERSQFEMVFLPSKFFVEKAALIDKISNEKEELIEALFEESYQQKRLYPYIAEDFSVMSMHISEEFTVLRIDMPTRDMGPGSCFRVYMTYNSSTEVCKYFTIEKGPKNNLLGEVNEEHKHISYGEAPVEGAELQMIIDLANETEADEITS